MGWGGGCPAMLKGQSCMAPGVRAGLRGQVSSMQWQVTSQAVPKSVLQAGQGPDEEAEGRQDCLEGEGHEGLRPQGSQDCPPCWC